MVGVNALVESGVPRSTIMSQKNINFFPYGRGDLGRTPTFSQVDLLVQQDVPPAGQHARDDRPERHQPVRSEDGDRLHHDAVSAMSSTSATRRSSAASIPSPWRRRRTSGRDARFGMASGFQDPRVIRLQAKFVVLVWWSTDAGVQEPFTAEGAENAEPLRSFLCALGVLRGEKLLASKSRPQAHRSRGRSRGVPRIATAPKCLRSRVAMETARSRSAVAMTTASTRPRRSAR